MPGMTQQEIGEFFTEVVRVFPGITLSKIEIQGENGLMSMIKFSKEDVGESTGEFTLLPAAKDYTGQIMNHEWKSTKSGGHMLALTIEITGGKEGIGRKVFDNLNLDCASEEAQKIALRAYKSICMACNAEAYYEGIFEIDAETADEYFAALPENLYGNDITLNIGIEKSKDPQYADKNKILQYGEPVKTTKPAAQAATAGKAKPSWAK